MLAAPLALFLLLAPHLHALAQERLSIGALAWMAGHWAGESSDGTRMEEVWLAPDGGVMVGVHRDVSAAGDAFFEFLRIAESKAGLVYHASPMGRPPTAFVATRVEPRRVVFANPEHDFPQRILYWLADDGLHARIEGTVGGAERATEWVWQRKEYPGESPPEES